MTSARTKASRARSGARAAKEARDAQRDHAHERGDAECRCHRSDAPDKPRAAIEVDESAWQRVVERERADACGVDDVVLAPRRKPSGSEHRDGDRGGREEHRAAPLRIGAETGPGEPRRGEQAEIEGDLQHDRTDPCAIARLVANELSEGVDIVAERRALRLREPRSMDEIAAVREFGGEHDDNGCDRAQQHGESPRPRRHQRRDEIGRRQHDDDLTLQHAGHGKRGGGGERRQRRALQRAQEQRRRGQREQHRVEVGHVGIRQDVPARPRDDDQRGDERVAAAHSRRFEPGEREQRDRDRHELRQVPQRRERVARDRGGGAAQQRLRQQVHRDPVGQPDPVLVQQPAHAVRVRPVVVEREIAARVGRQQCGDLHEDDDRHRVARDGAVVRLDRARRRVHRLSGRPRAGRRGSSRTSGRSSSRSAPATARVPGRAAPPGARC